METQGSSQLSSLRDRLSGKNGPEYWRSLEELAGAPGFQELLRREMPREAAAWDGSISRRKFLGLLGASIALAGLSSCTKQPPEKIIPYVKQPEILVPGKPLYYASAMVTDGFAQGIIATSSMGRPTKVEGNPDHPASLGATDIFMQASILTLYDPDRAQVIRRRGEISTWNKFLDGIEPALTIQKALQGEGIRILSGPVTSPTLIDQMDRFAALYPKARWHQWHPVSTESVQEGAAIAFGKPVAPRYRFDRADVVFSVDSDFLGAGPAHVRYARDFSDRRRVSDAKTTMNRLYVIERSPTITGAIADHRLPLPSDMIEAVVRSVAQELNVPGSGVADSVEDPALARWISALVADFRKHQGSGIVIAGPGQPPYVHALVHAINEQLGNAGSTVEYTDVLTAPAQSGVESLGELCRDIDAGTVDVLLILGGNPVYDAPVDFDLGRRIAGVKLVIGLGLYEDETAELCHWHIPESHYLETWSDARAYDGTVTIMQPLIAPLYDSKSAHELLEELMGHPDSRGYEIVTAYWKRRSSGEKFDAFWQQSLNAGIVSGTAEQAVDARVDTENERWRKAVGQSVAPVRGPGTLELEFKPDPSVWDGRWSNNGWLQELPKPMTKLTWDNAVQISPATAVSYGLESEDVVEIRYRGRSVTAPVLVIPGQADNVLTLPLGYGRSRAGHVGSGIGFNAYGLRASDALWSGRGVELRKTGRRSTLAVTQRHHAMEGRNQVRAASLADFVKHPTFAHDLDPEPAPDQTLYPQHRYEGHAWGMSIDLNACTGCNACVIACQSENNIPIVGKEQVLNMREMHWIRIDSYFAGAAGNPQVYNQPVPCMHCENAPCELVCPVGATVHDSEGLNVMVYNRCIGTRYCSNNCPYKVRRFNFLEYNDIQSPTLKMLENPDVTVRSRGVMEKCTYCIQRINAARIDAENANRPIADGEIVTACQSACPSRAIVFGDINDHGSRVSRLKAQPRNYGVLTELNTKPRTTYLAKLRNPNPSIEEVKGT